MSERNDPSVPFPISRPEEGHGQAEVDASWWKTALVALWLWAATGYFLFAVVRVEAGQLSPEQLWWPVAALYGALGKWPVVGMGILGGLILAGVSARELGDEGFED